ncbi:MAG TPA: Rieske 2Fe-2S domain-containing protein [Gemmatimonadaceae bacterium]|nr:Rieske 2Fe-2S domain-containing protein [Gemmatimonadaceae bacterium]
MAPDPESALRDEREEEIPAGFERVADVDELPEGALLGVTTMTGVQVCLYNHEGVVGAVGNVCTHQEFAMSDGALLPDGTIECAFHGARFDCRTGAVRQWPATEPLPVFAVLVRADGIYVGRRAE